MDQSLRMLNSSTFRRSIRIYASLIMMHQRKQIFSTSESVINLLGVVYAHAKTSNGGDIYFTQYGLPYSDVLEIENWYEKNWFESHRERLVGTSSTFRVPTKEVNGRRLQLVVKNCRVGEDVPVATHILQEFVNAEFNSPWEEFSLVMEMREGAYGSRNINIKTQQPLAIYVPPERLQLWQTGRSRAKINRITQRHPGIALDILRQYKLVYQWIEGLNIVETFEEIGINGQDLEHHLKPITARAIADLNAKGFVIADMKPAHIIISAEHVNQMRVLGRDDPENGCARQSDFLHSLIAGGQYSVIDYELLLRTPAHEEQVKYSRRHFYLDDQRDRFKAALLPPFLRQVEILGVPYIHGHAESTGGLLWVVGRNPHLFDYFLPERWRKTPCRPLSEHNEVFYTVTKDNVRIVWKTSRVGEQPQPGKGGEHTALIKKYGFNSPFEEFAIAHFLSNHGVPSIYVRAIYMTGSTKIEPVTDQRRFKSHWKMVGIDDLPILRKDHNYISIRGYFNGLDAWVASHEDPLCQPFDLQRAQHEGILSHAKCLKLLDLTRQRLKNVGYDGILLELNDILITLDPTGNIVKDSENLPETRICNFELIHKI
jgi:hypothetical protein